MDTGRQLQYLFGVVFRLVRNEEAIGYGPANNAGVQAATANFIALLNSDAHVINGWLRPLIRTIQSSSSIGMVCPKGGPVSEACSSPHQSCRRSVRDAPLVKCTPMLDPRTPFKALLCACVWQSFVWQLIVCSTGSQMHVIRVPEACLLD